MQTKRPLHPLSQSPLYKLRSRSKLAALLRVTNAELRTLSSGDDLYKEFDIPKKGGGVRHVENPRRDLKVVQARLAKILTRIAPPDYLYCPVKGRCYVQNAARHIGNRVVHTIDIKKYFPSTRSRRVFWFFHSVMKCERDLAALLTKLSSYQQHLPTGSPLSPILSFFAHYDVWEEIACFCRERGYRLTVYIDDCTISGAKVPTSDVWKIKRLIHRSGLRYHKEKTFVDRPAEITGVIVRNGRVVAPHRQFQKRKVASDAMQKSSATGDLELLDRIRGLNAQIAQIEKISPLS